MPNLFKPFSQKEEQGYSRKFEGTGLGLALVKNYCDINKANIKCESKKGVGSKFIATFNSQVLQFQKKLMIYIVIVKLNYLIASLE